MEDHMTTARYNTAESCGIKSHVVSFFLPWGYFLFLYSVKEWVVAQWDST